MKPKPLYVIAILMMSLIYTPVVKAQGIEITPLFGYNFADEFDIIDGYGKVGDGILYGIMLGKKINPHYAVELYYTRQEAKGEYSYYDYYSLLPYSDHDIPLSVNYIQVAGTRILPFGSSGKAEGIGGINLGAVLISPKEYNDVWRFAFGLSLGTRFWFSDLMGLRIQTNLNIPVQGAGASIYAGSGGVSTGVSTFSTITQFGFTGGLVFRLGHKSQ